MLFYATLNQNWRGLGAVRTNERKGFRCFSKLKSWKKICQMRFLYLYPLSEDQVEETYFICLIAKNMQNQPKCTPLGLKALSWSIKKIGSSTLAVI